MEEYQRRHARTAKGEHTCVLGKKNRAGGRGTSTMISHIPAKKQGLPMSFPRGVLLLLPQFLVRNPVPSHFPGNVNPQDLPKDKDRQQQCLEVWAS